MARAPISTQNDRPGSRRMGALSALWPFIRPYRGMAIAALGACTIITLHLYAARKGWAIGPVQVRVSMDVPGGDQPAHIEQIVHIPAELDAEQRERLEQIAGRCPIHRLLAGPMTFEDRLGTADEVGAVA